MLRHKYRTRTWIDPRQEFRISPTQGIGSFARMPIREGEVVEVVGGVVMTEAESRTFQRATPRFNAIQIDEELHLVEAPEVTQRRAGSSLNHSCDSNLWMADEVMLVARRDIAAGEELTVDYAITRTSRPLSMLELTVSDASRTSKVAGPEVVARGREGAEDTDDPRAYRTEIACAVHRNSEAGDDGGAPSPQ